MLTQLVIINKCLSLIKPPDPFLTGHTADNPPFRAQHIFAGNSRLSTGSDL